VKGKPLEESFLSYFLLFSYSFQFLVPSKNTIRGYRKKNTISRAQAVGKAARRLPPKSSQAEMHITGGARLAPLARTEYLIASYICGGN